MRDRDIRSALHQALLAEHRDDQTTLILDELGLCQGTVRADIAVVNGSLAGFEIKSDRDTLQRLPRQVEIYLKVFDYVTLVVGEKHRRDVRPAIPRCWGITVAVRSGEEIALDVERPVKRNAQVEPLAVARLLWRDEALSLLTRLGVERGLRSKPRRYLWEALVRELAADELCTEVRNALRARARWRSDEPRSRCGGSLPPSATS